MDNYQRRNFSSLPWHGLTKPMPALLRGSLCLLTVICVTACSNASFNIFGSEKHPALSRISKASSQELAPPASDDLHANMEYALLMQLHARYPESARYLARAESARDKWQQSLQRTGNPESQANKVFSDDAAMDLARAWEVPFLSTYSALNQFARDDIAGARNSIEKLYADETAVRQFLTLEQRQTKDATARQMLHSESSQQRRRLLDIYATEDLRSSGSMALKNHYQNAFSHYVAGFLREAGGDTTAARQAYQEAATLLDGEAGIITSSISGLLRGAPSAGHTELLIIEETGLAPPTIAESHQFEPSDAAKVERCAEKVDLRLPKLHAPVTQANPYAIHIAGHAVKSEAVVDLTALAQRALADNINNIVTSGVAKINADAANCKKVSDSAANASASTLLPAGIRLARITLPYGKHVLKISANGGTHIHSVTLDRPFQVTGFRVIGDQVYFMPDNAGIAVAENNTGVSPTETPAAPDTMSANPVAEATTTGTPANAPAGLTHTPGVTPQPDAISFFALAPTGTPSEEVLASISETPEKAQVKQPPAKPAPSEQFPAASQPATAQTAVIKAATLEVAAMTPAKTDANVENTETLEDIEKLIARIAESEPVPEVAPADQLVEAASRHPQVSTQASNAAWTVQVGAFRNENNARALRVRLTLLGFEASVTGRENGFHRVRVGMLAQRHNAEILRQQLRQRFPAHMIVVPAHG